MSQSSSPSTSIKFASSNFSLSDNMMDGFHLYTYNKMDSRTIPFMELALLLLRQWILSSSQSSFERFSAQEFITATLLSAARIYSTNSLISLTSVFFRITTISITPSLCYIPSAVPAYVSRHC